jgi:nicotinamide-nucleotide amidase
MTDAASTRAERPQQAALRVEPRRLGALKAHDYLIRFGFGFLISVVAAVIGEIAGSRVGGLFLAFPAILPATLTLVERKDGIGQALSDTRGATLGGIGMIAFALVMVLTVRQAPAVGLGGAVLVWVMVSGLAYLLARGLVRVLGEKQYLPEIPVSDAERLVDSLRRRNMTVATAESCTGGTISALLCSVPDAGQYLRGGVIADTDELKVLLLRVSPATLAAHGAISSQVAAEMASGLQRLTRADVAIAVTGATGRLVEGKPAGLTFVAIAGAEPAPIVRRFSEDLGPGRNNERAVRMALRLGEGIVRDEDVAGLPGHAC